MPLKIPANPADGKRRQTFRRRARRGQAKALPAGLTQLPPPAVPITMHEEASKMQEMLSAADRLRLVRKTQERFLALWAVENLTTRGLEKVSKDLAQEPEASRTDWTFLYRGSVLDD
jgi:hypothetical protein